jgi:hypothetical protein
MKRFSEKEKDVKDPTDKWKLIGIWMFNFLLWAGLLGVVSLVH